MKRPAILFLSVLAACGTPPRENPTGPPPRNVHEQDPPRTSSRDGEIVAFVNGRAVTWGDVTAHAMTTQGKSLIDEYIVWKLRVDRIRELGITNTPDDLMARAKAIFQNIIREFGQEAVDKDLKSRNLNEAQYLQQFVDNPQFGERVLLEKLWAYTLLTEETREIRTYAFVEEQDARMFADWVKADGFEKAAEKLEVAKTVSRTAQWPVYRVAPGLVPDSLAGVDWVDSRLHHMKKGETTDMETLPSGLRVVIHVLDVHPGRPAPYGDLREQVMAEVQMRPPSETQRKLLLARLFRQSRIQYEDRFLPAPGK